MTLPPAPVRADVRRILRAALDAADPYAAVRRALSLTRHTFRAADHAYDLRRIRRVAVVGAGKAAVPMARAVAHVLRGRLDSAFVVSSKGAAAGAPEGCDVVEAGHPVPDRRGLRAAQRMLDVASSLGAEDLLIVLLSGGASSLLPLPDEGLTLADKQRVTRLLLRSGATIAELNAVRKHLSAIKGGRLAAATRAQVLTLILSDVGGDDPGVIGSGPTAPDRTTFLDAVRIIRQYGLWEKLPAPVRMHLVEGLAGWRPETPKPRSRIFRRAHHVVVGRNRLALEAAARAARTAGYESVLIDEFVTGEAALVGRWMGELGKSLAGRAALPGPVCVLAGGELTVTVRGSGTGGRAQEFALAAALALQGAPGAWVAGFGTDGRDGPTAVAGAVVDGGTVARGKTKRLAAAAYLKRNDSYAFFKKAGGHIVTGSTGTNVNDLYLVLVCPSKSGESMSRAGRPSPQKPRG
ncbi:MAG: glycerate kinase [Nitrospirae bacterium]|nr:MAG: glycerate kinase [Nitrospirota bacterium]